MREARELIASIVSCEPESISYDSMPLRDLKGWDSLKHVLLVVQLEKRLGKQLTAEEIRDIVTVSDIAELIEAQ